MSEELVQVEGHDELARTSTRAIVNTSTSEYENFLARKAAKKKEQKRIQDLEEKVEGLESKLDTIISLLQE